MKPRTRNITLSMSFLGACAAAVAALYFSRESPGALRSVTVQLDWSHGADFAGYYAADQSGGFAAEGISVSFLAGGPDTNSAEAVTGGRAQFGTAQAAHLLRVRAQGKPVRAIACILRRSPLVFAALAKSGITHPRQFAGKTIRISKQAVPVLEAIADRFGITAEQYRTVQTRDLKQLYTGAVDVWTGYITGAVRQAKEAGHDLNILYPDNFGLHAYHECLFTTDSFIANDPEVTGSFLAAALEGWRAAVERPNEIAPLALQYNPDAQVDNETAHLMATRPLVMADDGRIGWMKPEVWSAMAARLHETGVLAEPIEASEVYTIRFLEQIHNNRQ